MSIATHIRELPDIDISVASRHCELLGPRNVDHIFAVFPEASGATHCPRQCYGVLDDVIGRLNAAQRAGCGVFVAGNQMRGSRRRKSEVTNIRAVQRDVDYAPVPELPLVPSLTIQTSPGRWQDYLFTDPSSPLSPSEAERINRLLATEYGGDRRASDITRLLRLAGSWHIKGDPFRVRIDAGNGRRYTCKEFQTAFPTPPSQQSPCNNPVAPLTNHPRYIAGAISSLVAELASAKEGHRNSTLNWCAFRLGQFGLGFEECATRLTPIAMQIGLPAWEVKATIRSGWRAGGASNPSGRVPR